MSIIAVTGIPPLWTKKTVIKKLLKTINGKFEALDLRCTKQGRICYLRLSERLDPLFVVQKINRLNFGKVKLGALKPDQLPDLPYSVKPKGIPNKLRRALRIPNESTLEQILFTATHEILLEMQSKYTGLYNVSKKTEHRLLDNIARILVDRLKNIMETTSDVDSSFKLTKQYRKKHPHFADFQLILSTLHEIEDKEGKPRTQLNKQEFSKPNIKPYVIDNVPYDKVKEICAKYIKTITKKLTDHVNSLNTDNCDESNPEEAAQKRVRLALKKIAPFFPTIINQVVLKNFVPEKASYYKMRVYGEPFMPAKTIMTEFLKRHRAQKAFRCDRSYNLLRCKVPVEALPLVMAADGSTVAKATIHFRLADVPLYKIPEYIRTEIMTAFGKNDQVDVPEQMAVDDEEEWNRF
ncbi:unnamed protein product [Parnassius apollo]|uniref:(apollo) hypothetical protein n=1 Tax=Parnassius apollo TaxID=110799 RepID=A0A8S3YAI5_PARAO|nr:unnamed protein product [Parnassius apollo]